MCRQGRLEGRVVFKRISSLYLKQKYQHMTKEQQLQHFNDITADMRRMIEEKGNDYADNDRLSNFKKSAVLIGTTAEMVCLNLIAVKVSRIANLISGPPPKNESIRDSVRDLANYSILLDMILSEGEQLNCDHVWVREDDCFGIARQRYCYKCGRVEEI